MALLKNQDRYIFGDPLRLGGVVELASSTGWEASYETPSVANGLFTSALLRALTQPGADEDGDSRLSFEELRTFVSDTVAEESDDRQHPSVERDNPAAEFTFSAP